MVKCARCGKERPVLDMARQYSGAVVRHYCHPAMQAKGPTCYESAVMEGEFRAQLFRKRNL